MDNDTKKIVAYFDALTKIPRQSGSEKAVAEYLCNWARENDFSTAVDGVNNVIIDCPPHKGFEDAPLTVLQAHSDMVCVAADGFDYNPLCDSVKYAIDNGYLHSVQTSIGADDGIGIAIAQFAATDISRRGALRLIFTSREETDLGGADALDASFLDCDYIINIDGECGCDAIISSAGFLTKTLQRNTKSVPPTLKRALSVKISGLHGGHSGMDIDKNIPNAIILMRDFLSSLPSFELALLCGGSAHNAIPSECSALILVPDDCDVSSDIAEISDAPLPAAIMSREDCNALFDLLFALPCGVISRFEDGSVQNSANIGIIDCSDTKASLTVSFRSNSDGELEKRDEALEPHISHTNFTEVSRHSEEPWDSKAGTLFALYKKAAGGKSNAIRIHAGLECGAFAKKSRAEIISVGPITEDVHSHRERIKLENITESITIFKNLFALISAKD